MVQIHHPTMGMFTIYLVYERLNRVWMFCECIGHEYSYCKMFLKLNRLIVDPCFATNTDLKNIRAIRLGAWITSSALIAVEKHWLRKESWSRRLLEIPMCKLLLFKHLMRIHLYLLVGNPCLCHPLFLLLLIHQFIFLLSHCSFYQYRLGLLTQWCCQGQVFKPLDSQGHLMQQAVDCNTRILSRLW